MHTPPSSKRVAPDEARAERPETVRDARDIAVHADAEVALEEVGQTQPAAEAVGAAAALGVHVAAEEIEVDLLVMEAGFHGVLVILAGNHLVAGEGARGDSQARDESECVLFH